MVDFVEANGVENLDDFFHDLDIIEDVTNMRMVMHNPIPVVGEYNLTKGGRSYILPPITKRQQMLDSGKHWTEMTNGNSKNASARPVTNMSNNMNTTGGEADFVQRQFKARAMVDAKKGGGFTSTMQSHDPSHWIVTAGIVPT